MTNILEILELPEKTAWESEEAYKLRMICRELKKLIGNQQEEINMLKRCLVVLELNQAAKF